MEEQSYLEVDLPQYLIESIKKNAKAIRERNTDDWDCSFCDLQTDINIMEVEQKITPQQAWYLREKYLGISKGD